MIKNSLEIKNFLRAYYQHHFYVEKDKRVKGEKLYVFTKSEKFPPQFLEDLNKYKPDRKYEDNRILLSLQDWTDFINSLSSQEKASTEKTEQSNKAAQPSKRVILKPYSVIYDRLLKLIPGLLEKLQMAEDYELTGRSKVDGLMDLVFENRYKEKGGLYIISLAHLYKQNGDLMSDPFIEIRVNPTLQTAEAITYETSNPPVFEEVYPNGKVSLKAQKSQNTFLESWLKNLLEQGHKILLDEADETKEKQVLTVKQDKLVVVISDINQMLNTSLIPYLPDATYDNPFLINKAIEKYLDSHKEKETFSTEEKLFLKQYSGYGGLEKYGATGKELLFEYFTPGKIIEKMWELAYKNGYKGGPVLEPAMGIGDFFRYVPEGTPCAGYEINPYSYRIAQILYPDATLYHEAFETRFIRHNESLRDKIEELPKFDLVIGNPPYGDFTGRYAGMGEKSHTKALTYVEYFILRGLQCLNPGGLLIYIIGVEVANGGVPFLHQGMTKAKEKIMELGELQKDTYRLCNGLFDRTDVLSEIILFKRK